MFLEKEANKSLSIQIPAVKVNTVYPIKKHELSRL